MTADWYKVSWDEQLNASCYVDKAMSSCRLDIDQMKTETDAMLGSWDPGATKDAYTVRQQTWLTSANDILDILAEFKASLATSADISSCAEAKNASTMAM